VALIATSHSKGLNDVEGGTTKQEAATIWHQCPCHKQILTPEDFIHGIKQFFVRHTDIRENQTELIKHFCNCMQDPDIRENR
jgi:hypothetical protein